MPTASSTNARLEGGTNLISLYLALCLRQPGASGYKLQHRTVLTVLNESKQFNLIESS